MKTRSPRSGSGLKQGRHASCEHNRAENDENGRRSDKDEEEALLRSSTDHDVRSSS